MGFDGGACACGRTHGHPHPEPFAPRDPWPQVTPRVAHALRAGTCRACAAARCRCLRLTARRPGESNRNFWIDDVGGSRRLRRIVSGKEYVGVLFDVRDQTADVRWSCHTFLTGAAYEATQGQHQTGKSNPTPVDPTGFGPLRPPLARS